MRKEEIEKLAEKEYPYSNEEGIGTVQSEQPTDNYRKAFIKGYQQAQEEQNRKAAMLNPPNLDDVMDNQKDFLTWYTTGNNKHYVGDKLIEAYKKEVLNQ